MSERTKKVVLAYAYTAGDDRKHKADATVSLPVHEANNLLARGRARLPESATDDGPTRVEEILSTVGDDKTLAQQYLDAEQAANAPRKTLVEKLQAVIDNHEES